MLIEVVFVFAVLTKFEYVFYVTLPLPNCERGLHPIFGQISRAISFYYIRLI